jgi:periplasmic protein TonB
VVFTKVEKQAEFPGGQEAWKTFLIKNIDQTTTEKDKWLPGKYAVIVKFLVDKDGSVKEISTVNYKGSKTAEQCIALMKKSPKWLPAKQNGHIVASYRQQPITFIVER